MKDWEEIIKERMASRKAELPESDWNDFLSRQAEHERAAKRRRRLNIAAICVPAAAAVLLLFLIPVKTVDSEDRTSKDSSSVQLSQSYAENNSSVSFFSVEDVSLNEYALKGFSDDIIPKGAVPVAPGDTITGIIYDEEGKPMKGINADEVDSNGEIIVHSLTDNNGQFKFICKNPDDSILIHKEGYEPVKLRVFRLDGVTASFTLYEGERVFMVLSEMPEFPGGQSALMNYLESSIKYPEDALRDSIQGRVIVQFVVEKDGSVSNPRVVRSVSPSLDAEAVRIVLQMPRWTPGKDMGTARRFRFSVPVRFRLSSVSRSETGE